MGDCSSPVMLADTVSLTVLVCVEMPMDAPTMPNPGAPEPTDESIPVLSLAASEICWSVVTAALLSIYA